MIMQNEKAKLEQKRLELQSEIQQKLDAKQAVAADLSEKKNEMAFVTSYITNVRKELRMRDAETAETILRKKTAHLQDNAALGDEMRRTQACRALRRRHLSRTPPRPPCMLRDLPQIARRAAHPATPRSPCGRRP
jgi:hypothetical protein